MDLTEKNADKNYLYNTWFWWLSGPDELQNTCEWYWIGARLEAPASSNDCLPNPTSACTQTVYRCTDYPRNWLTTETGCQEVIYNVDQGDLRGTSWEYQVK